MQNLNLFLNYLNLPKDTADAHIHLFDHTGYLEEYNPEFKPDHLIVGFPDIVLKEMEEYEGDKLVDMYKDYIENHDMTNIFLLATGVNVPDIIKVHKAFPDVIKGFGELKCYKSYEGDPLKTKNEDFVKKLCDYDMSLEHPMPIYIHWALDSKDSIETFENILRAYPQLKFVLCHCGMLFCFNQEDLDATCRLLKDWMQKYNNLWLDISYAASAYFRNNPNMILSFPASRIVCGSDVNPRMFTKQPKADALKMYNRYFKNYRGLVSSLKLDNEGNIRRLFS